MSLLRDSLAWRLQVLFRVENMKHSTGFKVQGV